MQTVLLFNMVPILSSFLSFGNAAGAALWAADMEVTLLPTKPQLGCLNGIPPISAYAYACEALLRPAWLRRW